MGRIRTQEHVKLWRNRTKERIIASLGGKCCNCGYSRYNGALEPHHIEPSKKEFAFGSILANPKKWSSIVEELRKCVLLCANCHRELHANVIQHSESWPRFNVVYEVYDSLSLKPRIYDKCLCGKDKIITKTYCSPICYTTYKFNIPWENFDIRQMVEVDKHPISKIARIIGCSDNAVKKKYLKIKNTTVL